MSSFSTAHNLSICAGMVVAFASGAALPEFDDTEANKETESWRVIWLGPAVVGVIEICLTVFVFKLEPISFCMMTDRVEEAS